MTNESTTETTSVSFTSNDTKLGMLEALPLTLVNIGQAIKKRNALTASAWIRGQHLAARCKPLLEMDTDITIKIIDAEQIGKHNAIEQKLKERVAGNGAVLDAIIKARLAEAAKNEI